MKKFTEESEPLENEIKEKDTFISEEDGQEEKPEPEEKTKTNKEEAREKSKEGILDSYKLKLEKNEIDPEEVPEWVQEKLSEEDQDVSDEEVRFLEQKEKIKNENLSNEKKEIIESEFASLVEYGLPKDIALSRAIVISGIDTKKRADEARKEGIKIGAMSLPKNSRPSEFNRSAKIDRAVRKAIEGGSPEALSSLEGDAFNLAWQRYGEHLKKQNK